ncbi:TFP11-domain-containing protein [Artomyces pyxidatus]|uniref:TFP11-domain-containing protein n=1 Tax=Artomyces pyxidatus TaxID=48021 RepID=A0ACB8SXY0_9AGAM|nr:TFP11-domain-containing protein [Artomyces pyxidatus]
MPRRKRGFMDDGISDSSSGSEGDADDLHNDNDPDAREERAFHDDPYGRKRRRMNGKEDAIYGSFADDSDEEGFGRSKKGAKPAKRRDWAKAPAFVPKQKPEPEQKPTPDAEENHSGEGEGEGEAADEGDEDEDEDEDEEMEDAEPSRAPSPRVREEVEEEDEAPRPRFGGLGLGASRSQATNSFSGFTAGGTSSRPAAVSSPASPAPTPPPPPVSGDLPSAFGGSRTQRAFVRNEAAPASSSRGATPLPPAERAHFSKLQGSFGARMLEKMGWQAGTGLGAAGEGIVTPVESKLRPKNMGIAFKGFGERTAQAKAEARRRGESVSDDEDAGGRRKPAGGKGQAKAKGQTDRSDVWKKPKKTKTKIEHKTYEQIVAETQQDAPGPSGIGIIIDATGATPREVSSLADVSTASWTPSTDPTRMPEVRHNLRLITEAATSDLDGLAREAKEIQKRRKAIQEEDTRLKKRISDEAELISRLQQVHLVVDDIHSQARELSSVYEASLDSFSPLFARLLTEFPKEFDRYHLDEIVVAAIAPIVRRTLAQWSPLDEPDKLLSTFRLWRKALKLADHEEKPQDTQVDIFGSRATLAPAPQVEVPMTPFESLMWNAWLPKVRSSINNDWDPRNPQPVVKLYEAWSTFLPPFIRDNVLDQLILPKVSKAVADWSPRKADVSLQTLVFPWLPYVGLRLEDLLGDARRKLKAMLRSWVVTDGVPEDFGVWRQVFDAGEWDAMLLKYIVPKLGATLREEFRVNPRQQDMAPLERVLSWAGLLRDSILAQLLEAEFFPKWLDVLHVWLVQPRPSFEEVAQWYAFWKGVFSESVQRLPAVQEGFTRGLQLMNKAIELGPDAPAKLPRPEHHKRGSPPPPPVPTSRAKKPPARMQEITFRSIVEEYAATHNLMFLPTGRAHETSRMPLYRVSTTADGKGGLLTYILDDAVWAPDADGAYRAISLESMVLRATKGGSS